MLLQRSIYRRVMRQTGQRDEDFSAVTKAVHNPFATSIDDLVDLDAGDEMTKSVRSTTRLSSLTSSCRTSIVRCEEVDSGFSVCLDWYYALELSVTTIEGSLFT